MSYLFAVCLGLFFIGLICGAGFLLSSIVAGVTFLVADHHANKRR